MKRSLIFPAALLLSACSTNSQLNVVDGLTLVAANDGVVLNPSRWIIWDHPLQTTYVSLNGQLGLQVGQVCTASRYRSPFTNNCREFSGEGQFYSEQYIQDDENKTPLKDFLNAVYKERDAQIEFVDAVTDYYACIVQKNGEIAQNKKAQQNDEFVIEQTKVEITQDCKAQDKAQRDALTKLKTAQKEVFQETGAQNRVVYNWAEALKFDGGVVVKEASNSISGNREKQASGYTVVNGLYIQRFQLTCDELQELKLQYGDSNRVKIVTMTLSADELYYDAREYKAVAFNAGAIFTPSELKALKKIMVLDDVEVKVNATLANTSDLSSKGHLMAPQVEYYDNKDEIKKGLTYYAVLTDLESFQCSGDDAEVNVKDGSDKPTSKPLS